MRVTTLSGWGGFELLHQGMQQSMLPMDKQTKMHPMALIMSYEQGLQLFQRAVCKDTQRYATCLDSCSQGTVKDQRSPP
jgi:hypothetical protein